MELALELVDFILNIDDHLNVFVEQYGVYIYLLLFLIVFAETGLVVTPFLPGDSLLFAVGALAATGSIRIELVIPLLFFAAVIGDAVNYQVGRFIGPKVFSKKDVRFLNENNLKKTQAFYEKHGGKAVIIARFLPIFRTFVPFVAGVGKMNYSKFTFFNITGAALWVLSFSIAGYLFGNIPLIKDNFGLVIIGIIVVSLLPGVIEYLKHRKESIKDS